MVKGKLTLVGTSSNEYKKYDPIKKTKEITKNHCRELYNILVQKYPGHKIIITKNKKGCYKLMDEISDRFLQMLSEQVELNKFDLISSNSDFGIVYEE
jgi:hypothetical protein